MQTTILTAGLFTVISLFSSALIADHDDFENDYYTYGEVIHTEPIIRRTRHSIPRTECHPIVKHHRVVRHDHRRSNAIPALLGGLLGGVIGHQFGGG